MQMIVLRHSCDKEESATDVHDGSDTNVSSLEGKVSQSDNPRPMFCSNGR